MVEHQRRAVGHDVRRHTTFHVDRLELFRVYHAVDLDGSRLVAGDPRDQLTKTVDGVSTSEGSRRMRSSPREDNLHAQRSLATRLDAAAGWFGENRHVTPDELWTKFDQLAQTGLAARDLLAGVKDPR